MDEQLQRQRVALGRFIRELREDRDPEITQADAAKAAGMSRQHWNRIERGETGTERETLIRIADAVGLKRDDSRYRQLFEAAGFVPPTNVTIRPGTGHISLGSEPEHRLGGIPDAVYDFFNDDTISDQAKRSIIATIEAIEAARDEAIKRERAERDAVDRAERERNS